MIIFFACVVGTRGDTSIVPPATKTDIERVQWFIFACYMYVLLQPIGIISSFLLMICPTCTVVLHSTYLTCCLFFLSPGPGLFRLSRLSFCIKINLNQSIIFFIMFVLCYVISSKTNILGICYLFLMFGPCWYFAGLKRGNVETLHVHGNRNYLHQPFARRSYEGTAKQRQGVLWLEPYLLPTSSFALLRVSKKITRHYWLK